MRRIIIIIGILQVLNCSVSGQEDTIQMVEKQYHSKDSNLYYYKINKNNDYYFKNIVIKNSKTLIIVRDKNNVDISYIVFNKHITDTLKMAKETTPFIHKNSVILHGYGGRNESPYNTYYKLNLTTGQKNIMFKNDSVSLRLKYKNLLVGKKVKHSEETYNDFFIYNLDDRSLKEITTFSVDSIYYPINNFTFLDDNNLFIWIAKNVGNWFPYDEFYKYNIQTGEITSLNEKIKKQYKSLLTEEQKKNFQISHLNFMVPLNTYINNNIYLINAENEDNPHIILDKNGDFIAKHIGLIGVGDITGFSSKSNKYETIFIRSLTKKGERIIIPFKYTIPYTKALAKIKNNEKITNKGLQRLDQMNLEILKNFVFAKHHYAFESNFYQAYFYTFSFYSDPNKEKTKNVNSLLTETDKYNLKLIKEEIERRKE